MIIDDEGDIKRYPLECVFTLRLSKGLIQILDYISQVKTTSKGEIVRKAILEYLENHSQELPYDLRTKAVRAIMEDTVQTIKDIKRLKYLAEETQNYIRDHDSLPAHLKTILKYLERKIVKKYSEWYGTTAKEWAEQMEKEKEAEK
jgi:predicted DNA-binding protein